MLPLHHKNLDANEQVYSQVSSVLGNQTASGNFTVPCDVQTGITRMRIVNIEATASTTNYAHTPYTYGETEDYCVNVIAGAGLPVVTCPSDIIDYADGSCQAVVNYSASSNVGILSYEFSGATVGSGSGSGSGSGGGDADPGVYSKAPMSGALPYGTGLLSKSTLISTP